MRKVLRNNPVVCGLLGVLIGSGGTLGTQALIKDDVIVAHKSGNNFDVVPYSSDGDIIITAHGKKYHYEGCSHLSRAKKTRRVRSSDAAKAGLGPCSRCQ